MANAPTPVTDTPVVKTKTSELDRLKALAVKIATKITKVQLTSAEITAIEDVANLLLSTVTHSTLLSQHKAGTTVEGSTTEAE